LLFLALGSDLGARLFGSTFWHAQDVMLCDPLTKQMDPYKLLTALDSNFWDLRQPPEALARKCAKQEQRRSTSTEAAIG